MKRASEKRGWLTVAGTPMFSVLQQCRDGWHGFLHTVASDFYMQRRKGVPRGQLYFRSILELYLHYFK